MDPRAPCLLALLLTACRPTVSASETPEAPPEPGPWDHVPLADGFDPPVGPPDGTGYRDAQGFGENGHLGEDWNGLGGGDSDLGDPVYAIAAGVVTEAWDHWGGWGQVVRVVHRFEESSGRIREVESLYAHLDTMTVRDGQTVARGQQLGTIGDAHMQYLAHLHLELRARPGMPLGGGYSGQRAGWLDPSVVIGLRRPADVADPPAGPAVP